MQEGRCERGSEEGPDLRHDRCQGQAGLHEGDTAAATARSQARHQASGYPNKILNK